VDWNRIRANARGTDAQSQSWGVDPKLVRAASRQSRRSDRLPRGRGSVKIGKFALAVC
jgi:hypothetical protein